MKFRHNNPVENIMLNIMDQVSVEKGHLDYNTQINTGIHQIWMELEKEADYIKRSKIRKCFYRAVQLINKNRR